MTTPAYPRNIKGSSGNTCDVTPSGGLNTNPQPSAVEGLETYSRVSLALHNTGEVIKASAGTIYGWSIHTKCTSRKYVKLYDMSGAPENTDTPHIRLGINNASSSAGDVINNFSMPHGIKFANGIGIRTTDGSNDSSTTNAGDCLWVNIFFK